MGPPPRPAQPPHGGTPRLFPLDQRQVTTDDRYTPAWLFEAMGITFDLDVCAPPGGVPWVPATRYYTQADDGLTAPWEGRVWMNPPFSNALPWVNRFVAHRHGIAVLPMGKAEYTHRVWDTADGIVLGAAASIAFVVPHELTKDGDARYRQIFLPCWLAAFGDECVEAVRAIGMVRRIA